MSSTAEIAIEVDRLVVGVHRAVMTRHRTSLREAFDAIGLDSPGLFYDLAEFFAGGVCTFEIARRRCRYEPDDPGGTMIGQLRQRQLLDARFRPMPNLLDVLELVCDFRAEAAANLWQTELGDALQGSAEALASASGTLTDAHRSLPEPIDPAHRLHHLLTGVRYARFEAHIAAWTEAELTASEIVALSTAATSEQVLPAPQGLVSRGWLTDAGAVTVQGRKGRSTIEAETNARCQDMFNSLTDRQGWFAALCELGP